jgi:chromosome segregation ATPase
MNPRTALIVAGLALVVGVVGLVIGISAKNGNKSDQDIADATKAQLEQQLGTTASQVQGAEKAQASKEQAQANQQAEASKSVNVQLADLRTSVDRLDSSIKSLQGTSTTQANDIKTLQDDVNKLDTKVANLEAK